MKRLALLLMLFAAFAFAADEQEPAGKAQKADEKQATPAPAEAQSESAAPKPSPEKDAPAGKAQKADEKQATPAPAEGQSGSPASKPSSEKDAPAAADTATPTKEKIFDGVVDVGARWVSSVGGDMNTYRSVVNLGEGVRLVNVDLRILPPAHENKVADSVLLQAHNWGDPYNSMRLDMQKNGMYRFTSTYSNMAYYNYLPSYADPTMTTTGVFMNQRAYDTQIRNSDNELLFLPGHWIQPYIAYSLNTDSGHGISTLVNGPNNQYPIVNNIRWGQNIYRGGVRVQLSKLHLTFEQGAITFKDDQGAYSNGFGLGDRTAPYLGQTLYLTNGYQAYYVRGDGNFTKGYGTWSPASWIDVYGQIFHSNPSISSTLNQAAEGNIPAATPNLVFYSSAFDQIYGSAAMPRTSFSLSTELRFMNRFRIRQSFDRDSFHDNSSSTLGQLFYLSSGLAASLTTPYASFLQVEQNRSQTEVLVDITKQLMVRGGYRYEWGSAEVPAGLLSTTSPNESGELLRHVFLAGSKYRPAQYAVINLDFEASDGVKTYYRTGLQDYVKLRVQARFTLPKNLFLNLGFNYLDNHNPDQGVEAKYTLAVESASLQWVPTSHKFSLIADYTHSQIESNIAYITFVPYNLANESRYMDNATAVSMMAEIALPGKGLMQPKLSFGGSMVATAGSRPSRYYQPQGKLLVPIRKNIQLYTEWQWYGLNQPFYDYEGFRAHTLLTGVRFLM